MLQFAVSQQHNETPFIFRSTGIRVYTFEEALYHVFHYWRESVDDFLSETMIAWVAELGLSYIASKLKDISREKRFTKRILDFLQVVEYFNATEISDIKTTLQAWEQRLEWEKLKERADYLVNRGEPSKALPLYKRALQFEENAALLNNIAVAHMQLALPQDAMHHLTRARTLEPENMSVLFHYIEAAILAGQYNKAGQALAKATELAPGSADIPFLYGLSAFEQKNYATALEYYEKAAALDPKTPHYTYQVANAHTAMRQYDKALAALATVPVKDANYYVKEAEIHAAANDTSAALRCMRRATDAGGANTPGMWAKLAEYYRKDYDWQMAEQAIAHALKLAPENDRVRLENARIKKGLGRTREYQAELTGILKGFKERYRAEG